MKTLLATLALLLLAPALVSAQSVGANGIFSCNETGAYAMSAGSLKAVGGTFVPVSDDAVTLNTGYLAYKECTLRPVVAAQSHAITASLVNAELQQFLTGNNGNPYFVQNYGQEQFNTAYGAINPLSSASTFSPVVSNLNTAFQQTLQTALARSLQQQYYSPYSALTCPYSGNLGTVLNGQTTDVWGGLSAMMNPACSPLSAYMLAQNQLNANATAAAAAWQTQLNWGNGIYPILGANGNVATPGILVGTIAGQALLSGQQQLLNANDIGQITTNQFMTAMANRILSGAVGGLASLNTSSGTTPSYLAQSLAASSQELGTAVTNLAIGVLGPALTLEQQYNQVETSIANTLLTAITTLQNTENACWGTIVTNLCTASSITTSASGASTCTAADGTGTLHIATSTNDFAKSIVTSQIKPLADAAIQNVNTSNQALTAINTLIQNASNNPGSAAQQAAIAQLDALVAQNALHTQADLDQANSEATQVDSALNSTQTTPAGLIPQTLAVWDGDGTQSDGTIVKGAVAWDGSSQTGWCNVQTGNTGAAATLAAWEKLWSK